MIAIASLRKLSWGAFQGASDGNIYKSCSEQIYRVITENMKCLFWRKCRNFLCKRLTDKILEVTLDQYNHFELIYAIVKVFIFEVKNAIVWFSIFLMRYPSCFWLNFRWCFLGPQKVEQRYQKVTVRREQVFGAIQTA